VFIEGRLKLDQWEDRNGGGKRSKLSAVVESFQFVDSSKDGGSGGNGGYARSGAGAGGRGEYDDGDIPF
jgi:single-strand DNA-binding protein